MKFDKTIWFSILVLALMWIVAAWYYPQLPEAVPIHFNAEGQPDNYMNKPWGALLLPFISTGVFALLVILPALSPKGFRLDSARRAYGVVVSIIMAFMLGVMVISFEQAQAEVESFDQWIVMGLGVLFLLLGNYLGKFPKNFWIGIRSPWTLASDEVWFKTHRLAGRTFMAGGLLVIVGAMADMKMEYVIGVILFASITPVLYSLVLYKRLHGFDSDENE